MLLINGKAKLYAVKSVDGRYVLCDLSITSKVTITTYDSWELLFTAATHILNSAGFEASLEV